MAVRFAQLSEGYPVPPRHLEAHCYRGLDKAAARMYIRLCGVCLAVVPVGIAAVEQPSIAKSYSDGAVAAGVAWKGDEDDFSVADLEWRGSLEAEPLEASGKMRLPSGPVQCVLWPIRAPPDPRAGAGGVQSSIPQPVSTRPIPSAVSNRRQWITPSPRLENPPVPSTWGRPYGGL